MSKEGAMGTAVHPYIMAAVFDPEATRALALAFDDICKHMNLAETATHARETVATRIIDLARDGILDPNALRERVMHEARVLGRTL
jgi:hypothetical protein